MLYLATPGKPPAVYGAEEEGQYRLSVYQALRRIAALLGVVTLNTVTVTTTYQMKVDDAVIRMDTTSAGFTTTLQPSASVKGQVVHIKKVSTDGNTATVAAAGAELIDGSATLAWTTARLSHTLFANGTGWDVLV